MTCSQAASCDTSACVDESHNERRTIARAEAAFRDGRRDEAGFRRLEGGRLILGRYPTLRDAAGAYRGMMETMQDIIEIVGVEGAQLTPDWD